MLRVREWAAKRTRKRIQRKVRPHLPEETFLFAFCVNWIKNELVFKNNPVFQTKTDRILIVIHVVEENTPPRTPTRPTSPPDFEQKRAEELRKEEEERRRKEEERKKREIEEEEERKQREEEQRKKEEEEQKRLQELARKKVKEELTARRRKQWQIQDDREELNTITPQSEARYPPHNEKLSDSFSKLTAYTRE